MSNQINQSYRALCLVTRIASRFHLFNQGVNLLRGQAIVKRGVDEEAVVVPVVVGPVAFGVIGRRQRAHFVAVDGVVVEEALDSRRHFARRHALVVVILIVILCCRRRRRRPLAHKSLEHGQGSHLFDLAKRSHDLQFRIQQSHIRFVGLDVAAF